MTAGGGGGGGGPKRRDDAAVAREMASWRASRSNPRPPPGADVGTPGVPTLVTDGALEVAVSL